MCGQKDCSHIAVCSLSAIRDCAEDIFVDKMQRATMATPAPAAGPGNPSPSPSPAARPAQNWTSDLGSRLSKLDPTSVIVFSVACVVVLVLIIAYIVWRVRRRDLKSKIIVRDPMRLYGTGVPYTVDKSIIPSTVNGQEYSYSFWMYLVQYDASSSQIMIFGRGIQPGGIGGSPLVYLDNNTNKMYVSIAKNTALLNLPLDSVQASSDYVTATIDYVPLQRWVNVAIVVQDYLLTVFMDGDIYTVSNVTDAQDIGPGVLALNDSGTRSIFGPTSGDIIVGAGSPQAKAFVSQIQFFNFALTQRDVRARYARGPLTASALSVLGIPAYGIRSPVYKIE